MNALTMAKQEAERLEMLFARYGEDGDVELATMYAAIAQADALQNIAQELDRLNNSASLITSLEAEIVLDIHTRRASERASYAAYLKTAVEDEEVMRETA